MKSWVLHHWRLTIITVLLTVLAGLSYVAWLESQSFEAQKASVLGATITHVETSTPIVSLTFDDGPSTITQEIVSLLHKEEVPATFFMIGRWIDTYPHIVKYVHTSGFEIGNHTNTHPLMTYLSPEKISQEFLITEEKISYITGERPRFIRTPYGWAQPKLLPVLDLLKYQSVGWNIDPEDWKARSSQEIVEHILAHLEPGSIILLHDGPDDLDRTATLEALPLIISQTRAAGYTFVPLEELLTHQPASSAALLQSE